MIKDKWKPGYNIFYTINGLKFSEKVGMLSEIGVSPKKVFTFLGALDAALPRGNSKILKFKQFNGKTLRNVDWSVQMLDMHSYS